MKILPVGTIGGDSIIIQTTAEHFYQLREMEDGGLRITPVNPIWESLEIHVSPWVGEVVEVRHQEQGVVIEQVFFAGLHLVPTGHERS